VLASAFIGLIALVQIYAFQFLFVRGHGFGRTYFYAAPLAVSCALVVGLIWTERYFRTVLRSLRVLRLNVNLHREFSQGGSATLAETLDSAVCMVEAQFPGSLGTILLLDEEGLRLLSGAGPNLPPEFNRAMNGLLVGPGVGACGMTALERRNVIVPDIEAHTDWPEWQDLALGFGLRACWSFPVFSSAGRILGTFAVYSLFPRSPKPEEVDLLESCAHLIGTAIENRQAEDKLRVRVKQQAAVAELGQNALECTPLPQFMDRAVELVTRTCGVEYCKILELSPQGDSLKIVAGAGWKPGSVGFATVDAGPNSQAGYTLLTGGPVIVENYATEDRFALSDLLRQHEIASGISVIIQGEKGPWGVLAAQSVRLKTVTADDVIFLQSIAYVLAEAVVRRRAEEALRSSEDLYRESSERLARILNFSLDVICTFDAEGRFAQISAGCERLWGYCPEEMLGMFCTDLVLPEDQAATLRCRRDAMSGQPIQAFENRYVCKDGSIRQMMWSAQWSDDDQSMFAVARDVTERNNSQKQLKLLETSVERLNDIVIITTAADTSRRKVPRIVFVNDAFQRHTGYSRQEVMGKSPSVILGPKTQQAEVERIETAITNREPVRAELISSAKDGRDFWLELDIVPVTDEAGAVSHWVAVGRDTTERKAAEGEIQYLAFYDPLTRLPNRKLLLDRLEQAFTRAKRSGLWGAALFLDLDHFKLVNDTHGHQAGDEFLQRISQRLVEELRASDTVSRYGGDEFVVILEDLAESQEAAMTAAQHVAQKIRHRLSEAAALQAGVLTVSASQGIALFPSPEQVDAREVLRQADIAVYRSKESGRDHICLFENFMATELSERLALDQALRGALQRQEFSLDLQTKTNARAQVTGAEVLLRWKHGELGMVSPSVFIPLAEESGAILSIGEWVLRESCILLSQAAYCSLKYSLSVNVSPRQLRQPGFVQLVKNILQETGASPAQLTLEVTEGHFLSNMDDVICTMKELRALGVRISIDDFGTGYSCLFYLQKLPLDELKIDQSFVQSAPNEPSHAVLIDTILAIARHLGLGVVAEGIETEEQLLFLLERGCSQFQGFYFGRPVPAAEFLETLQEVSSQNSRGPWQGQDSAATQDVSAESSLC